MSFSKCMLIQNRQRLLLVFRAGGLLLNIILNMLLLFSWRDPRGAAVASIIAEILVVVLMIWNFQAVGWGWRTIAPSIFRLLNHRRGCCSCDDLPPGCEFYCRDYHWIECLHRREFCSGKSLSTSDWDLLYRLTSAMPGGTFILRYWKRDVELNW